MKKLGSSVYILIAGMAVMLAVIVMTLQYPSFATRLLPLSISSAVFVLAAIQLVRELLAKGPAEVIIADDEAVIGEESRAKASRYLPIAAWLSGFALAVYLVGFVISILFFTLFYMKLHGSRWLPAILSAVIFTGIMYIVFDLVLHLDMNQGMLFR